MRKTIAALQQRVWWPNLHRTVKQFVQGCTVCQRVKDVNQAPAGLLQPLPISDQKFQQWSMDFITDLPELGGYNALFVCVDKFSKLCRLVPTRAGEGGMSAQEVAALFYDAVVRLFGVPRSVLHDRDPRFTAQFWQALWRIMGCKTLFSSAYHPQTDGQTERHNRTVE